MTMQAVGRRARALAVAALGALLLAPSAGVPALADTGAMATPIAGTVTSQVYAGCNSSRPTHAGIDLAAATGTRVVAAYAGTVTRRSDPDGYGYYVDVAHVNGYTTRYAHLSGYVAPSGSTVSKGQLIAYSGNTGSSTGPHLHFEVRLNGQPQSGINGYFTCGRSVTPGQAITWTFPGLPVGGGGTPTPPAEGETINDLSGDGAGDLLATTSSGSLLYYKNNRSSAPYSSGSSTIGGGWSTGSFNRMVVEDFTGDGAADVIVTKAADSTMWVYPNNSGSNTGGLPFDSADAYQVGSGWGSTTKRLLAGDLDGDGRGDLVTVRSDGSLYFYRNTGVASAVRFAAADSIGQGWAGFSSVQIGDISGDNHADLVAVDGDGTLLYYPNNSGSNAGGVPFESADRRTIGSGWTTFDRLILADISGDGSADALATKPDGTLLYYPNNRASNPGGLPFAGGVTIGHGWGGLRIGGAQPVD